MDAPVLIDLFCAAGGASEGYRRAGFRVIGVDLSPQPHYPGEFIQADALAFLADRDRWEAMGVAAWAASPPCFLNSSLRTVLPAGHGHLELIPETRAALIATGLPYVIENVPGADMIDPLTLCGSMFGLGADCRDGVRRQLRRHRLFESRVPLTAPGPCCHVGQAIACHGGGPSKRERATRAGSGVAYAYQGLMPERREAMGITWMSRAEMNLSIPPAYTEWIGRQLVAQPSSTQRYPGARSGNV